MARSSEGRQCNGRSPPPWRCQSSPRLETRPTPARHMIDGRRTGDQDFDFFFPRRRSASNSRPPPASTKALIPAPTAISGTAEWGTPGGVGPSTTWAYASAASPSSRKASSPILRVTARYPDIGVSTLCLLSIVVPSARDRDSPEAPNSLPTQDKPGNGKSHSFLNRCSASPAEFGSL